MKIAIICSSFFPVIDGVTIAVFNRVKQLSELGHQVLLFCPDYKVIAHIYPNWQDYTGELFNRVNVINLPSTKSIALEFERDVTIKSYSIVLQELDKFKPDIIHVDEAERLSFCFLKLPGVKYAKEHNISCISWFHTNYIDYLEDYFKLPLGINKIIEQALGWTFAKIYNSYDLTLVSSLETFKNLKKLGIKNLHYSELLGCDFDAFSKQKKHHNFFTKQYSLPNLENKVKLVFIGRLTPDKGWNFALRSLTKLSPNISSKIALVIAGDGTLKEEIDTTLKSSIADTYLLGRISPQSIPALLKNSDLFITNSEKETRGLTVIEAAAAGIPAIAPRARGVIDTIDDGETGFLYQPQNQADFIAKLELLINNKSLRDSMGEKAKKIAVKWSWQQTTSNLIEIWSQEIREQNAP
ncbi:MAG: glycosyltransferase [Pleurocapsa sp.]